MVSGYEVDLVDEDKMDEFIVKFKGPPDSPYFGVRPLNDIDQILGRVESSSYVARPVSYKVTFHRLCKQNFPSKHR